MLLIPSRSVVTDLREHHPGSAGPEQVNEVGVTARDLVLWADGECPARLSVWVVELPGDVGFALGTLDGEWMSDGA